MVLLTGKRIGIHLNEYVNYLEREGDLRDTSQHVYAHAVGNYLSLTGDNALSPKFAQAYIDMLVKEGKSPSTVNLRANALLSLFKWKGIKLEVKCPSIKARKPEYLSSEEIGRVIGACKTQLEKTLVFCLYDMALRISELLSVTYSDIDWRSKTVCVTRKGGRIQDVNISQKAIEELKKYISLCDYGHRDPAQKIFSAVNYYYAWRIMKSIGKRAGVHLHPHVFRHSRAIHMLKDGAKPYVVQQHLGHKSISTTMDIYGMFMAGDLRESIPSW